MLFFLILLLSIIAVVHALPSFPNNVQRALPIGGLDNEQSERDPGVDTSSTSTRHPISNIRIPNLAGLGYSASIESTKAFTGSGSDEVSENTIPLISTDGVSPSQRYRQLLSSNDDEPNTTVGSAPIRSFKDEVFMTPFKVGDQDFTAVLDVGSSDTWLVMTGYKCAKQNSLFGPRGCGFGRTYNKTSTFVQVPNQHFSTSFVDKSFARGIMGTETVALGNITITRQPMGFADTASWTGDGVSSGILGLAFPSITNAYPGTDYREDKKGTNIPYPPIFTSMHRKKLIKPYFSIALNRMNEGPGILALGGLPGPSIRHTGNFARVPMQQLALKKSLPLPSKSEDGLTDYRFYVVNSEGFTVNNKPALVSNEPIQVIIDSGSRFTHLPSSIVEAIAKQWQPPAKLDWLTDEWMVDCAGTPPKVGVIFNGTTVYFDSKDLVITAAGNICLSTIQKNPGGDQKSGGMWVLGASYLRGVVAVFDVGAAEMRFANRVR